MTDNEIIKGLQCCNHNHVWQRECFDCEYATFEGQCGNELIKDALDLINRQNQEIERLTQENDALNGNTEKYIKQCENRSRQMAESCRKEIKSEAIREFAERSKRKSQLMALSVYGKPERGVFMSDIDSLVEEMTGGEHNGKEN